MEAAPFTYVIIGGGLAGASAIEGIRERDTEHRILLLGNEAELPYDRPPLTKKLWFGKKKLEDIYLHDARWYETQGVALAPATEATHIDPVEKVVVDQKGTRYRYEKLLLATGGVPRQLAIPGGNLEGISYYRYLANYQQVRSLATAGATAVVIGGGFIGSEMAAALTMHQVQVHLVFPSDYLVSHVFPVELGTAIQEDYQRRGIVFHAREEVTAIQRRGDVYHTQLRSGQTLESTIVIAGIGIDPATRLAAPVGLEINNGLVVDEYLRTSQPDIFAAGDLANFPYLALGQRKRVEHWDNAMIQGQYAGRNMAGAQAPYDHLPYFFSDLFDFGYEAVGEVESRLETFQDWEVPYEKGVIYYLQDGRVRGAMMCNVWEKVDAARELIRQGKVMTPEDMRGAIR